MFMYAHVFPHKLIVDCILWTYLHAGSATDTFRMVGCLEHIYVHLTRFCTLLATDTFIIFDFNP